MEKRKIFNDKSSAEKDKKEIEERIEEIKNTAQQDFAAERRLRQERLQELQKKLNELESTKKTTELDMQRYSQAVAKARSDQYEARWVV